MQSKNGEIMLVSGNIGKPTGKRRRPSAKITKTREGISPEAIAAPGCFVGRPGLVAAGAHFVGLPPSIGRKKARGLFGIIAAPIIALSGG